MSPMFSADGTCEFSTCSSLTATKSPCQNRAWWPGGPCYIHVRPMSIADWLDGIVRGIDAGSLPPRVDVMAMLPWQDERPSVDRHPTTEWHAHSAIYSHRNPQCIGEAKIVVIVGRRSVATIVDGQSPFQLAVDPADALVAIDLILARYGETSVTRRLAEHIQSEVQFASALNEAVGVGVSHYLVIKHRERLGRWNDFQSAKDLRFSLTRPQGQAGT